LFLGKTVRYVNASELKVNPYKKNLVNLERQIGIPNEKTVIKQDRERFNRTMSELRKMTGMNEQDDYFGNTPEHLDLIGEIGIEEYQKQQNAIYGELELMRSILRKRARRAQPKN
jgi:hypothetical protein